MKTLLLTLLSAATVILSSCGISSGVSDISRKETYLNLKIFQTLDRGEALAVTEDLEAVKIVSAKDIYYDGKRIRGVFVLVDTYTYKTQKGDYKTVPVFVLKSERR